MTVDTLKCSDSVVHNILISNPDVSSILKVKLVCWISWISEDVED